MSSFMRKQIKRADAKATAPLRLLLLYVDLVRNHSSMEKVSSESQSVSLRFAVTRGFSVFFSVPGL